MVEPSRTGLMTSGSSYVLTSRSTSSTAIPSLISSSSNIGILMLACAIIAFARALSMHSADARTGVRTAEQLEHPLHSSVFTKPSVQRVEDAIESAIAQHVPRGEVDVDAGDLVAAVAKRVLDLRAGLQRHLALGRLPATQDRHLHFLNFPTISTSVSSSMLKRRRTSAWMRSMRRLTSSAVAPPSLTMKLPCSVETTAFPSRAPFRPAACTRRPAESPGGFWNTLPQFFVLIGCVSLRSLVSLAISAFAASPSPRSS